MRRGNLRFILGPQGGAQMNYFIYNKYDGQNRLIETGTYPFWGIYFTDNAAEDIDFPVNGNIRKLYCYDEAPSYGQGSLVRGIFTWHIK